MLPDSVRDYLSALQARVRAQLTDDAAGLWLIGSAAQDAYDPGVSDLDVMLVTHHRHDAPDRHAVADAIAHPHLTCPAVGLEFVWYARSDLEPLADPVRFQLNLNGGPERAPLRQLEPGDDPQWWAVLDLAAARAIGVPLGSSPPPDEVLPPIPDERLRAAVRASLDWHDTGDAGSPNRVLNLARMVVLLRDGEWIAKTEAPGRLCEDPELVPALDEALRARAEKRWLDPALAAPLSSRVRALLGTGPGPRP